MERKKCALLCVTTPPNHSPLIFPPSLSLSLSLFLSNALLRSCLHCVVVTMPSSCVAPRDHISHRYFDKRTLYLGAIAELAEQASGYSAASSSSSSSSSGGSDSSGLLPLVAAGSGGMALALARGDPRKPQLLLRPLFAAADDDGGRAKKAKAKPKKGKKKGKTGAHDGEASPSSSSHFVVRLTVNLEPGALRAPRLLPDRSNVRRLVAAHDSGGSSGDSGGGSGGGSGDGGRRARVGRGDAALQRTGARGAGARGRRCGACTPPWPRPGRAPTPPPRPPLAARPHDDDDDNDDDHHDQRSLDFFALLLVLVVVVVAVVVVEGGGGRVGAGAALGADGLDEGMMDALFAYLLLGKRVLSSRMTALQMLRLLLGSR